MKHDIVWPDGYIKPVRHKLKLGHVFLSFSKFTKLSLFYTKKWLCKTKVFTLAFFQDKFTMFLVCFVSFDQHNVP